VNEPGAQGIRDAKRRLIPEKTHPHAVLNTADERKRLNVVVEQSCFPSDA
jgi:hypothetical protein